MTPLSLQLDPAPLCVTHTHAVHQIKDDNMSRNLELGFYGRGQRKDMAAIFLQTEGIYLSSIGRPGEIVFKSRADGSGESDGSDGQVIGNSGTGIAVAYGTGSDRRLFPCWEATVTMCGTRSE